MGTAQLGSVLTAMVTPFDSDGRLDLDAAAALAAFLTRDGWNDGLVVNGTTGESITTSDAEKAALLRTVVETVGGRARVIAGVGTADTRHSVALTEAAEAAGADGLLVVTPYYSRPSQRGVLAHVAAIAASTRLPIMLYDIPKRSGIAMERSTLAAVAELDNVVAVKDATGDLESASWVMRETPLTYYSGDDALNLPFLAIGAAGFVSVAGHLVADRLRAMAESFAAGDVAAARRAHLDLLPVYRGLFRAPAVASTKAALAAVGVVAGGVRSPIVELTREERAVLLADLAMAGISPVRAGV